MAENSARRDDQRAADADREAVAEDLREAFGEGRLDHDEYERRLDDVWGARTYGELDLLTADLPEPRERVERETEAERQRATEVRKKQELAEYLGEWKAWLGGAVIMIGIWGVTSIVNSELGNFWPGIPLGIWAVVLLASGMFGGNDDS